MNSSYNPAPNNPFAYVHFSRSDFSVHRGKPGVLPRPPTHTRTLANYIAASTVCHVIIKPSDSRGGVSSDCASPSPTLPLPPFPGTVQRLLSSSRQAQLRLWGRQGFYRLGPATSAAASVELMYSKWNACVAASFTSPDNSNSPGPSAALVSQIKES